MYVFLGLLDVWFSLEKRYNYIIQGAGASGLWLAYWLQKEGLLTDKSLLIVECDAIKRNDRTWCFWGEELLDEMPFVDFGICLDLYQSTPDLIWCVCGVRLIGLCTLAVGEG